MTIREKWAYYFELIAEIYDLADQCEKLASNHEPILLTDKTYNKSFRGILQVNDMQTEKALERLISRATETYNDLTNKGKLTAYFPMFLDDISFITVNDRVATSSRKYNNGFGLLGTLPLTEKNEIYAVSKQRELNKRYGKDFCEVIERTAKIDLKIDADVFIKSENCEYMRVREVTCNSYYCSLYKDQLTTPIRAPMGFRFVRHNDDVAVNITPPRKEKPRKYHNNNAVILAHKSAVFRESK